MEFKSKPVLKEADTPSSSEVLEWAFEICKAHGHSFNIVVRDIITGIKENFDIQES